MGSWAKRLFGEDNFESVGLIVAGTTSPEFEEEVLNMFDNVIHSRDAISHAHLVEKNGKKYPIVFGVYGAPAMMDVLAEMHDGGCRNVIFVGSAYGGFKNLNVGDVVIAERSYHFDGMHHHIKIDREFSVPDSDLQNVVESVLNDHDSDFTLGTNISVPSVTYQLPHNNEMYKKINPLTVEMEVAALYSRSSDIGIRAVATLIISDTKSHSIGDPDKKKRYNMKKHVLDIFINNLDKFTLEKLPNADSFKIDSALAEIIADPTDEINVYKN